MENKDKGDGIKDSPLDMLLVILLEGASMEVSWFVTASSLSLFVLLLPLLFVLSLLTLFALSLFFL